MCNIPLAQWFTQFSIFLSLNLLLTVARYYMIKLRGKENILLYMIDLFVMNSLYTYLFIKANIIFFSDENSCKYTSD